MCLRIAFNEPRPFFEERNVTLLGFRKEGAGNQTTRDLWRSDMRNVT